MFDCSPSWTRLLCSQNEPNEKNMITQMEEVVAAYSLSFQKCLVEKWVSKPDGLALMDDLSFTPFVLLVQSVHVFRASSMLASEDNMLPLEIARGGRMLEPPEFDARMNRRNSTYGRSKKTFICHGQQPRKQTNSNISKTSTTRKNVHLWHNPCSWAFGRISPSGVISYLHNRNRSTRVRSFWFGGVRMIVKEGERRARCRRRQEVPEMVKDINVPRSGGICFHVLSAKDIYHIYGRLHLLPAAPKDERLNSLHNNIVSTLGGGPSGEATSRADNNRGRLRKSLGEEEHGRGKSRKSAEQQQKETASPARLRELPYGYYGEEKREVGRTNKRNRKISDQLWEDVGETKAHPDSWLHALPASSTVNNNPVVHRYATADRACRDRSGKTRTRKHNATQADREGVRQQHMTTMRKRLDDVFGVWDGRTLTDGIIHKKEFITKANQLQFTSPSAWNRRVLGLDVEVEDGEDGAVTAAAWARFFDALTGGPETITRKDLLTKICQWSRSGYNTVVVQNNTDYAHGHKRLYMHVRKSLCVCSLSRRAAFRPSS
eukprot:GHVS01008215.1.p1 GENE.GHVS01008215.1~~GHVS01008215.1.p1  ORF type:complete len:580 (-),score=91.09 GHVS01008215.1:1227-2867(-)